MKTIIRTIGFFFLIVSQDLSFGQITHQQAIDKILNEILVGDTGKVNIFISKLTVDENDSLKLYGGDYIKLPFMVNWVCFVDDQPSACWGHHSRYIFISEADGDTNTQVHTMFPSDLDSLFDEISQANKPAGYFPPYDSTLSLIHQNATPEDHKYAVIISGEDDMKFWYSCSLVFNTLVLSCIIKRN